jgi:O-antigen/teichoic acid export membrane protein
MGKQRQVLNIVLAATLLFHPTALILIPQIGAMGANIAHIAFGVVWLTGLSVTFRRALRQNNGTLAIKSDLSDKQPDADDLP